MQFPGVKRIYSWHGLKIEIKVNIFQEPDPKKKTH